ncbi:hypothetical protein [Myroides guanonis]|uniref:Uncharacterized protein n=1 Tax=Myroides guanonis TaxID=1150112 RepID=A0A1I3U536_9FLAO|nr:hypothetical protein [Myroides guanonis]SFJ76897.1 hypothetical protein SAMN04487893_11594 [Myroides guanonis]
MEKLKFIALLDEFENSGNLIKLGFGEIQNINLNNSYYFLPFQLLSQGFERLMKVYICVGHFHKFKKLPDSKYIRILGHDLEKLLDEIIKNYYLERRESQFILDKKFLDKDLDLKELLFILSEFGKLSRYHNFDIITGSTKLGVDTKNRWQDFENKILNSNDFIKLMDFNLSHEVFQKISTYIIIVFEKFVSSLSRQIIFDSLGDIGKQVISSNIQDFGMLYEKDFGVKDYRVFTTRYLESPLRCHKRTIEDENERKHNPNYKYQLIKKIDFEGEWPFYCEEVVIECRYSHWCIISIEGYDYALNGSAKGRYKLENPHDAGMAILGESLSKFISMTLNLGK